MSSLIYALSIAAIALVVGVFVFAVMRTLVRSARNDNAPILSADASVVSKRTETGDGTGDEPEWTRLYATFAISSGNQMELEVSAEESELLAEGDAGILTFQGMQFISFVHESLLPPEE